MSKVFVRNIPIKAKESDFESLFSKAGQVTEVVMKPNYVFVGYDTERESMEAIKQFHDYTFMGHKLSVEAAKSRTEKLAERMNEKCFKCGDFGHWAISCKSIRRQKREEKRKFKKVRKSPKRSFSRSLSNSSRSRSRSRSR
jgi:RNA recognition motif-containing protein